MTKRRREMSSPHMHPCSSCGRKFSCYADVELGCGGDSVPHECGDCMVKDHCKGCDKPSETVYCDACAKTAKCVHGNKLDECDHCDHLSDQAYDAAREDRGR